MKIKTNEELYDILGTLDKFNFFLENFKQEILQKVMLAVPALVIHHIKNEHGYNKLKDEFFLANPELVDYKPVVAQQLNIIAAEHTDWDIQRIFTAAGIETKKIIRQSKEVQNGQRI